MTPFEVAVLAGGSGTRLKSRTGTLPKPMVPIRGRPALEHQIELCRRHGFVRILLLVHYGHEAIRGHFGDGAAHGVTLGYASEQTPRGTAGALRDARPWLADTFLVLYGDTYLDVDLRRLWDAHGRSGADATLLVHPNDHPHDSDLVELGEDGWVTALHPSTRPGGPEYRNLVSAGLLVATRGAFETTPAAGTADVVRHTLPALLAAGRRVFGYRSAEYIKDFGTPERLDRVERDIAASVPDRLSERAPRAAVFLDRDGTLNREVDHLSVPEQLELIEGATEAVGRLNRAGCLAVVITNQPVLARAEVTEDGMDRIQRRLEHLLGGAGAYLDATYICPHHPDGGFAGEVRALKVECECRKPRTGSIDAACRALRIGRAASWLVGDTTSDIEAGRRAGLKTILVRTGHAGQDGRYPFRPDYVTVDLAAAVDWVLEGHRVLTRRMAPVAAAALDARLVLIGGLARSGKSFAAQVLKEAMTAFGRDAHVLSLDSWLKLEHQRAEGSGVEVRFDTAALTSALEPILRSADRHRLEIPVYDRARRTMYERRLELSIGPDDLLIVEGVLALLVEPLLRLAGVKVHVEIPEPQRVALLRADYRWRGESDAALDGLLASRALDESGPVEAARARADFVVPGWTAA